MREATLSQLPLLLLLAAATISIGQAAVVRPTVFSDLNSASAQEANSNQLLASSAPLADGPQAVRINPFKSRLCTAASGLRLEQPLGLHSMAVDDLALSASSHSNEQVGPHLARLNLDVAGGAWCPMKPISSSNFGKEWIQVKLNRSHVVSAIETQGRFGQGAGKEFVPSYQVEYSRDNGQSWHKWKDLRGSSLLRANEDTSSAVRNELSPPIVGANVIRLLPFSQHLRTVCLRFELHGCPYDEGAPIAYASQDGVVEPRWGHLIDYTYDGQRQRGQLSNGLGQLVDGVRGPDNFSHNNGFEWVGWKSMNGDVWIEFAFNTLRNFSSALFHSNNLFSSGVEVFQAVDVHLGIAVRPSLDPLRDALAEQRRRSSASDAISRHTKQPPTSSQQQSPSEGTQTSTDTLWSADVLSIEYEPDKKLEQSRPVTVHLKQRLANRLRFQLKFASKWILISEVDFLSQPVELLSLDSLNDPHTPPLLAALAPAKSYDEYVAILREHQLRRIATAAYLDSMGSAADSAPAPDLPPPPSPVQPAPSDGFERKLAANLGMIWQGEQPATNPLLSFGANQPPSDFQPPLDGLRNFLVPAPPPSLGRPPALAEPDGAQRAGPPPARTSQLGMATLISFLLLSLLLLGLLFALSTYRLRQAPKLGSPSLHAPYQPAAKQADFMGFGPPASPGGSGARQLQHQDHYSAIYAGLPAVGAHQEPLATVQHQHQQQRTLRRLATLGPKHQQQLLVSLKDQPLFSSGTHKPQPISTQLIVGLNQPPTSANHQHLLSQQIYNNSSNNCAASNQTYATHYSTSMSLVSSSTNGHQADYNDYAIPDVQLPVVPARLGQPPAFGGAGFGEPTAFNGLHRSNNQNNQNNQNNNNC